MARTTRLLAGLGLLAFTMFVRPAAAGEQSTLTPLAGAALTASNGGGGLALDGRLRLPSGIQLGVALSGEALRVAYIGGRTAKGVAAGEGSLLTLFPILRADPVELDLRFTTGVRYLRDVGVPQTPYRDALRSTSELAFLAHVRWGTHMLLRAGVILGADLQVDPEVELADQTQLITLGIGRSLTRNLLLFGSVDAGGSYGFDGDNGKSVVRGALGLRMTFDADARTAF